MNWLLLAFLGPVLWAISTHIDKFLVDKYFRDSDTAVLMVFTALLGVIALPVIWLFDPKVLALSWLATGVMTLSGVLYMGAMLFYLRAIQTEDVDDSMNKLEEDPYKEQQNTDELEKDELSTPQKK